MLREMTSKVSVMHRATLFKLQSLLAILQQVNVGEVPGCSLAGNISSLTDSISTSSLPCPDDLELGHPLLGTGTLNYTCLSGDEGDTSQNAGAIGEGKGHLQMCFATLT